MGNKPSGWPSHKEIYAEVQPQTARDKIGHIGPHKGEGEGEKEKEKHKQFAMALALIVPAVTPHQWAPSRNITPEVLATAGRGGYADCWAEDLIYNPNLPVVFTDPKYWLHLQPAIEAVWREIYG